MRLGRIFRNRLLQRVVQYLLVFSAIFLVFSLVTKTSSTDVYRGLVRLKQTALEDMNSKRDSLPKKPDGEVDYSAVSKVDWHDYALQETEKKRTGNGEQGAPFALPTDPETKKLTEEIYKVNGFSGLTSDHISLNRSLKDIRNPGCAKKNYLGILPTVSVVVPFHNEHWTTLLRTAITVILRSPESLLREVILVDDGSTKEFLKSQLDEYVKANLPLVKVVRTTKREGLIRARQIGARAATSDALIFLDSHSEPNWNWIPPLLEPIALDYRTAVCPFVDVIDCDTFEYKAQDEGGRGSFDWEFNYKRLPVPEAKHKDKTGIFENPVMAGGYFAISRKWFWELGGYDEGLDIWGGEQYELSFKIWQCGGRMYDAPCSRVGHIYRCKYVPFPNPGVGDFISRNYRRVADVWMDEYATHLIKRRPGVGEINPGDLTKQKAVRDRLNCKPFKWFMTEVAYDQDKFYPAVEPPDGASGELKSLADPTKCVDTQFKGANERFGLRKCVSANPSEGGEQQLRMSFWHDIRPMKRSVCFDVSTSVDHAPVILFACHGMKGNQLWRYLPDIHQLWHRQSSQCLDSDIERGELFMTKCDSQKKSQQWEFQHVNTTMLQKFDADNRKEGLIK